jgi:hypothetical protein
MKNKLAYLGFLGLLGFAGFFGTFGLLGFLGFFGFFGYSKVVPDELFWSNVRTCATCCFFIFLVSSSILLVSTLLLAANDFYNYANMLIVGGFGVILAVCMFIFCAGLGYLGWKERAVKDDDD